MNKYNFQTYIDFGSSKIRMGVFDYELPKNNLYNQIELFNEGVLKVIEKSNNYKTLYDIIFMDPPYKENKISELLVYIF